MPSPNELETYIQDKLEEYGRRVQGAKANELTHVIENLELELKHLRDILGWVQYLDKESPPEAEEAGEGETDMTENKKQEIEEQDLQKVLGSVLAALKKKDYDGAMKLVMSAMKPSEPAPPEKEPQEEDAPPEAETPEGSESVEEPESPAEEPEQEESDNVDEAAPTKSVSGVDHPRGDFLVVEDPEKPTTWHLPVKKNGKPDHRLMGGAKAALTVGYRGEKYAGPGKAKALSALKAMYKSEDMEWVGEVEKGAEQPTETQEAEPPKTTATLCESYAGAISIKEMSEATKNSDPLTMHVQLIQPGWGNKADNHYYPKETLKRDAHVFIGAKMFETDHDPSQTNNRTWVSTVTGIAGLSPTGAPIAEVIAHDPGFIQRARNLAAAKDEKGNSLLEKLECSIKATGETIPYEEDGREGTSVERIVSRESVDWVSRAGAGGHAVNLVEADPIGGGGNLEDEQVAATLKESWLPDDVKGVLSGQAWADEAKLKEAVTSLEAVIKRSARSGEPFGMGDSTPATETIEEAETRKEQRFNEIMARAGLRQV